MCYNYLQTIKEVALFMDDQNKDLLINKLADVASVKSHINPALYTRYNVKRGLRNNDGTGVLVGLTEVGEVMSYIVDDADRIPVEGKLYYQGYDVTELVDGFFLNNRFGFEETAFLLLTGDLPTDKELAEFNDLLTSVRPLPDNFTEDMILKAPSPDVMNKLARSVLALYSYDDNPDATDIPNVIRQCTELIARFPVLISYGYMARRHYIEKRGLFIHNPKPEYNTAQNILHLIRPDGKFTELEARILDLMLVLHAEHGGGNNSTFVTHAVSSTGSDTYSVIASAVGSLKGPQHGGASGKAYAMMSELRETVTDWEDEDQIRAYLTKILNKEAFDHSGLIYGIGHAVYTLSDPRTVTIRKYAELLAKEKDNMALYDLYLRVERLAPEVFHEVKNSDKIVCANVDFFAGLVYSMLGIPSELYTPLFACGRIAGWSAHRVEEIVSGGRIIRPAFKCVNKRRPYCSLEDRKDIL
ncbi:MAG: citrate/2-methylcitrate synthase [Saccharofermentans sp.]|nr:citrate/2-methylcitrate synthase [Saccharofermentans sp.]